MGSGGARDPGLALRFHLLPGGPPCPCPGRAGTRGDTGEMKSGPVSPLPGQIETPASKGCESDTKFRLFFFSSLFARAGASGRCSCWDRAANTGLLRLVLYTPLPVLVFAFLFSCDVSEKKGIGPVTADQDPRFDPTQKRQTPVNA